MQLRTKVPLINAHSTGIKQDQAMMQRSIRPSGLLASFERLSLSSSEGRLCQSGLLSSALRSTAASSSTRFPSIAQRAFSTSPIRAGNWLLPTAREAKPSRKGRPHVATGGSSRGTTVVWGDYGLRMRDRHRRVSAAQLKIGEDAIKVRLRGMRYRLYTRVAAQIGVYTSGNEVRMGKGKGSFDYWAARIPLNRIIFELKGEIHEKVARDAFRLAGNKMPGTYEFVKKGDPPVVGTKKLENGVTLEDLKRPRRAIPLPMKPETATLNLRSSASNPATPVPAAPSGGAAPQA